MSGEHTLSEELDRLRTEQRFWAGTAAGQEGSSLSIATHEELRRQLWTNDESCADNESLLKQSQALNQELQAFADCKKSCLELEPRLAKASAAVDVLKEEMQVVEDASDTRKRNTEAPTGSSLAANDSPDSAPVAHHNMYALNGALQLRPTCKPRQHLQQRGPIRSSFLIESSLIGETGVFQFLVMADAAVKAGVASPPSQEDDVGNPGGMKMLSSPVCVNLMGRTERALRMALGGALIMALTMCDIPHMDYSFKYIGPFLFFVIGTLAPPFVSSAGVVLFAALFCILLACASVTLLLACLLLDSGGQALCICVYALLVVWSSCLSVSKTKDMTLIGSYILLYILPLATLMCAEFVRSGISVEVTPERYLALQQFLKNSTVAEIKEKASHFFLLRPSTVDAIVDSIGSSQAIMLALKAILAKLKIPDLPLSGGALDLEKILQLISLVTQKLPAGMPLSVDLKVSRDWGLDLPQGWMYDMPLFIEGVVGERVVIGARPGAWFIKTLWVASGPMGILRNLIIFAFLGFAVYLLVMLVPPIRRQRDVAVREMAAACFVIRGWADRSAPLSLFRAAFSGFVRSERWPI
ncbi:hypothetical protein Efla_007324 [Eimeria flavescens]